MSSDARETLPDLSTKPTLLEYIECFLPFTLPRIPLPQTAKNLDKAVARVVLAKSEVVASELERASKLEDAKASVKIELLKAGAKAAAKKIATGDTDLLGRAINAAIAEEIRSQHNREAILEHAADELQTYPPTIDASAEIDIDWLNMYSTLAANISRGDMQSLWGKVLAGEIRNPGSFKLKTLHALSGL